ncbi:MAG: MarC family protein [Bacteroidota bacterium]|jgi:putative integral membrane protein of the marC family protein|nr:MAG: MarC family protein [Bacteroidota bacterium]
MGEFSFVQFSSAFIILFAIIDITGSIPIILSLKSKGVDINPVKTSSVALGIMILFLFLGERIMSLFHVDIESFAVAGAFVLFIMSLEMILDVEIFRNNTPKNIGAIVPIAFPLVAGPGSFTAMISLRAEFDTINIFFALIANLLFVFVVLKATGRIEKLLGKGGIYILRKFFGIILLAIAVKLFTSNVQHLI